MSLRSHCRRIVSQQRERHAAKKSLMFVGLTLTIGETFYFDSGFMRFCLSVAKGGMIIRLISGLVIFLR